MGESNKKVAIASSIVEEYECRIKEKTITPRSIKRRDLRLCHDFAGVRHQAAFSACRSTAGNDLLPLAPLFLLSSASHCWVFTGRARLHNISLCKNSTRRTYGSTSAF